MHHAGIASIAMLLASPSVAWAANWLDVQGSYLVAGRDYLDPAPDAPSNTHLYLQLHGQAAADLFNAMPGEPSPDPCTGGVAKHAGMMACVLFPADPAGGTRRHECSFSIDLARQRIDGGVAC